MFRVRNFTSIIRILPVRTSTTACVSKVPFTTNFLPIANSTLLLHRKNFSSDGGKKVCDEIGNTSIKSHPSSQTAKSSETLENVKLKDCNPIEINPCKPSPLSMRAKVPSTSQCAPPNELSQVPPPGGSWSDNERKTRQKGRRILIFGALLTAASIGAVYYIGLGKAPTSSKGHKSKKKPKAGGAFKDPYTSADIPQDVPYLLIGGGTASFSAFRAIKSSDPTAKVLIISNESYYPYMRPPLSKEIWFNDDNDVSKTLMFKQWNGSERSLFYEPDDFYTSCKELMASSNGGVAVARGWTITHIDVMEKLAYLDDGVPIKYNKCLIATGATPRVTPVFEVAMADENLKDKIKLYRNIDDFKDVIESFPMSKSIAIVGGGFLGSELSCAFGRRDKRKSKSIYQIFRETGNMGKILPEYLSLWTSNKVRKEGVQVIPNTEIVGVKSKNDKVEMTLSSGKTLSVDFVVVSVGVASNTELAEKSDLEVDPELGGYLVNTELMARTDLYIAGDCSCFYDPRLGRRRIEHHDHAVVSGRLAGENMAGARKPYEHQSMFWSDLGPDVGYEAIGIVDSSLPTVGVFAKQTAADTPLAICEKTDEGDRSKTEQLPKTAELSKTEELAKCEELPQECEKYLSEEDKEKLKKTKALMPNPAEGEDYGKGVIFYLRDDIVVGIVLWNVFNRMSIARQVLQDQKKYDDLNEVAKLFNIHGEE